MGTFGNITSDSRQCAFPGGSTDIQTMALGGTGANLTAIAGGVVYSTATQLAITAAGTSTQVLHGNGAGAPTWGAVALTADVTGVLPVANGGTNKSSWTDGGVVFAGPAGATLEQTATTFFWDYVLGRLGIGNNTPQVLLDLGLVGTTAGVMRLAGLTSGNVTIQPAAAAGTWTLTLPITDGAANEFLKTDGAGVTSWSRVVLTTDVSGTLPVGNGGSGATTLTGVLYGNGASAFTASVGTANYLPKWSATAPYLTGTSLIYDNGTNVGVGTITPFRKLDVTGAIHISSVETLTLTGTANPTASTTLVGTGTAFTTELMVGDRITINVESRTVVAIASDTSLTVDTAFTDTAPSTITLAVFPFEIRNGNTASIRMIRHGANTLGASFEFIKNRGASSNILAKVVAGDTLTSYRSYGIADNNGTISRSARYDVVVPTGGVPGGGTTVAGDHLWATINIAGTEAERMRGGALAQ